ncbi:hypothetical protein TWF696_003465 [Orbilia brochopaga]|uniref:Uncharacterized protein n=1 Tax=Orbilia brochopaga TaxID=3140254 RepID=A0AAV9TXT1_9PEZI
MRVGADETGTALADSLGSPACEIPAFRFFQNATLVLNQLLHTDASFSTCSQHDSVISAVEMCGTSRVPYQCELYIDNTCSNRVVDHVIKPQHANVTEVVTHAYRVLFSDPNNEWVTSSWGSNDEEVVRLFHRVPTTTEEYVPYVFLRGQAFPVWWWH